MPIPWSLPSAADIEESYEKKIDKKLRAFSFVGSRYTFRYYEKDVYDLDKQRRATMPNLIHYLDATTIALLYKDFCKYGSLYTIHDCFAVTANNVPYLINILKSVYLNLYSSSNYLKKFDDIVRININNTYGIDVFKVTDNYVYIPYKGKTQRKPFPNVNKILELGVENKIKNLEKSSNIIV